MAEIVLRMAFNSVQEETIYTASVTKSKSQILLALVSRFSPEPLSTELTEASGHRQESRVF